MVVLSYGFQQPENGDKGSVWFPALNADIKQLNDHDHDGVTSSLINAANIAVGQVTATSGGWTGSTGFYSQTLSVPSGFNMSDFVIQVQDASGNIVYPTISTVTSYSFSITSPDDTFVYTVNFR